MTRIRIFLAGATGWVGCNLAAAVTQADDFQLTSAAARPYASRSPGDVLELPVLANLAVFASVDEALDAD